MKKILIIGSKGFIGSYCTKYFKAKPQFSVSQADVLVSSDSENYVQLDFGNPDFTSLFHNKKFDYCINASGSASVPYSLTNPAEDFRLNVGNVNHILHAIRTENPECRFINFSSAAVYGNPASLPVKENAKLAPISPYGFHKMISEQICSEFWRLYKIPTCSLRVFSAYGPCLRKQLFWDLHQKIKTTKPFELFGTGDESRDFIHIDDICEAVDCIIKNAPMTGETVNVAAGKEIDIRTAVELFVDEYDPMVSFTFNRIEKPGDPKNWLADISIIRKMGFVPKVLFRDGIKSVSDWLKKEL